MRRLAICAAIIGFAVLAGGAGLAGKAVKQDAADGKGGGLKQLIRGRIDRRMTLRDDLNLTDSQRAAIKQTLKAHKGEIAQAVKPVVVKKRALRDALMDENIDESAIRKAAVDLGNALGDAGVTLAKVKADVKAKANLTPEQMKKISEFRSANDASVDGFLSQLESAQ